MPRTKKPKPEEPKPDEEKTSAELSAEIEAMIAQLAQKKKTLNDVKKKEDLAAEQARKEAEIQFNQEFVEKAKEIRFSDYESEHMTVYEVIKYLIRPPEDEEPLEDMPDSVEGGIDLGALLKKAGGA